MHFYQYFQWLCRYAGVDEPTAYKGCGLNRSSVSRWRTAMSENREIAPSAKAAFGIAAFFGVPAESVSAMKDARGLSPQDWLMIGTEYRNQRELRGIQLERAADGDVVTQEELKAFECDGIPLTDSQLVTVCGLIGADPMVVFAAWKGFLWPDSKKAPTEDSGRFEDGFTLAAHKYSGKLSEKDKAIILQLMETLAGDAEEVENGRYSSGDLSGTV